MAKTTTFRMSEGTSADVVEIQRRLEALWQCGPVSASSAIRWAVGRAVKLLSGEIVVPEQGKTGGTDDDGDDMFYPDLRETPS